jgi:hypothetical protein
MNKPLPFWHHAYKHHIHQWNSSFITESEPMTIQFIPKNNIYTVKDHLNIMKMLREILLNSNPDYSIELLNRKEGGFQVRNKQYYKKITNIDNDLQIRSNILSVTIPTYLENKVNQNIELFPESYNKSGVKIFQFTANINIPKKLMLYLYAILESMNMLVYRTENFPDMYDIVWESKDIWENPYLYNPI